GILDLVAAVGGCQEAFTAAFLPGAGAAGAHGEQCAQHVLGVEAELAAKPAADVGSNEPQLVQRQSEAFAERSGMDVGQLTRRVMRELATAGIESDNTARPSSGAAVTRLLIKRRRMTMPALAKARATLPPARRNRNAMLFAAASCRRGAPSAIALSWSTTAGSGW